MRKLPKCVLQSLSEVFCVMLDQVIGPVEGFEVLLDLLAKKGSGYRTVCTFPSLWRLFIACLSPEWRGWDIAHAWDFDSATAGKDATSQVFKQEVMNAIIRSEGGHVT